jgi:hypothetical protein
MSLWARFKFLIGILVVVLLVFGLVLYLEGSMSTVRALQAELGASSTTVGVDYPGLVTAANVGVGDKVTQGETLFVVQSPQLTTDIANHTINVSTLPFSLDKSGDILVKANSSGVIQQLNFLNGAFVPGGAVMATIYSDKALYISGTFTLSPPDYSRVKKGSVMSVTFPDDSTAQAIVYDVALVQSGGKVNTVVQARLQGKDADNPQFPIGTPVEATLRLRNATWWEDTRQALDKVFKPRAS